MRVGRIREVSGDCNLEREREWNVKRVNAGRRRQPDEEDDGGSNRTPDESAMMWREAAEAIDNTRGEKDMMMVCEGPCRRGKEKEHRDHKSVDERMKLEMHRGEREGEDAREILLLIEEAIE